MAINDYNKVLEIKPDHFQALINRGLAYYRLGNNQMALKDMNRAIEINSNDDGVYVYAAAVISLGTTINIDSSYTDCLYYRGFAKYQEKDIVGACRDFERAAKHGNKDAEIAFKNSCK